MYIICMEKHSLTPQERELFTLVARASIVNHFDEERLLIDRQIAKAPDTFFGKELLVRVIERISEAIKTLENEQRANIQMYAGEDRRLVEFTFLFEIFHKLMEDFDQLIIDQIKKDESSIPVSFLDKAIIIFQERGFTSEQAVRYFANFFQLRRAYYFIKERLVGTSPCMQKLRVDLWNNVFTCNQLIFKDYLISRMEDFSTLILGETGTGKGTAAAAIGRSGFIPFDTKSKTFAESFTQAFVSLNLSQYPETLIESELFGHRKGAFTGAIEAHDGIFAKCSPYGAIFLDEIGDASIPIQIKLLHVLQERTFTPVGSHKKLRFSGRVIAATNKDINSLRQQSKFRDDFYYRLCSDIIKVPSLYERITENQKELEDLVNYAVIQIVGVKNPELVKQILAIIDKKLGKNYRWPGNVRELEQCVRRIILKQDYEGDIMQTVHDPLAKLVDGIQNESIDATCLLSKYCGFLYQRHGTYEAVSKIVGLDRRTVKRYVEQSEPNNN